MLSKHRRGKASKQSGWLNIYRLESAPFVTQTSLHTSAPEAEKFARFMTKTPNDHEYITTIRVEWDEPCVEDMR